MKIQFPVGWLSRGALGRVVVAMRVGWRVSGEGDDVAVRGEGFAYGTGWPPVRGGQASQCRPGCALQMTMSVVRV